MDAKFSKQKKGESLEALPLVVYVIFTLLESLALIFVCTRKSDARSALRYQSILLHLFRGGAVVCHAYHYAFLGLPFFCLSEVVLSSFINSGSL